MKWHQPLGWALLIGAIALLAYEGLQDQWEGYTALEVIMLGAGLLLIHGKLQPGKA